MGTPPKAGADSRIAVFPIHDLSTDRSTLAEIDRSIAEALRLKGLEIIDATALEPFLARHRIRYTGGVNQPVARAARAELGVDAILVSVLEQQNTGRRPRLAISMRLVDIADGPTIAWVHSVGRVGDDSPGLLDLGVIRDIAELRNRVLDELASSLHSFLAGNAPRAIGCAREGRYRPRTSFRGRRYVPTTRRTVAILPFVNHTNRRAAGEIVALHFIRQLLTAPGLQIIDPGEVRQRLLSTRSMLNRGVSLTHARLLLDLLEADTVVLGDVFDYDTNGSIPTVDFSVTVLDGRRDRVIWRSSSHGRGDDGFYLFELGRISTASELTCRLIAAVIDELQRGKPRADAAQRADRTHPPAKGKDP